MPNRFDIALFERTDGTFVLHRAVKIGKTYSFLGDAQSKEESGICDGQIIAVVASINRAERELQLGPIYALRVRTRYFFTRVKRRLKREMRKFKAKK